MNKPCYMANLNNCKGSWGCSTNNKCISGTTNYTDGCINLCQSSTNCVNLCDNLDKCRIFCDGSTNCAGTIQNTAEYA